MNDKQKITLMRAFSTLLVFLSVLWLAQAGKPVPLLIVLGVVAALVALRTGQQGEARYGRRITVTEMLPLGRQGDKAMLVGGIAGYLMVVFFGLAAWFAWQG